MNQQISFPHLLAGPFAVTLVWLSTLCLGLGLSVSRLLHRHAAKAHLALMLAAVAGVVSPVLAATARQIGWGVLPARPSTPIGNPLLSTKPISGSIIEENKLPVGGSLPAQTEPIASVGASPISAPVSAMSDETVPTSVAKSSIARVCESLPAAVADCWIIASLILAARLMVSLRIGGRIVREAHEETSPRLLAALREAARALGLGKAPDLRESEKAQCPMIWCWGRRPVLLVPESAAQSGGVNWRSVFCHELAHLVRRDHWSALWAEVLVIALPWQPLAWLSRRRLAFLREQACDDWVLAAGGKAIDYAESLVNLVPQRSLTFALPALRSGESLEHRLSHILRGVRVQPTVGRRWMLASPFVAFAAAAGVALLQEAAPSTSFQAAAAADEKVADKMLIISGQVVDQKHGPVPGARIAVIAREKRSQRGGELDVSSEVLGETTSTGDGRFELRVPRIKSEDVSDATLFARAPGRSLAWHRLDLGATRLEVPLTLADEQVIRGRFVDLQGQPAAGVRAHFDSITSPQSGWFGFDSALHKLTAWPEPIVSDRDGRFAVHNVAAGLGVNLEVEGSDRFARQSMALNTGISEARGARDGTYRPQGVRNLKPGEQAVLVLAPAQIVEGRIRFADTKQPVAGARITVFSAQQQSQSFIGTAGRADGEGRFQINPHPGIAFRVTAYPPHDMPYLTRQTSLDWKPGMTKGRADLDLPRGVLVRGVIVEAESNRRVAGASIQYEPEAKTSNRAPDVLTGWAGIEVCDAQGRFAIPVLPGRGTLLVHGPMGKFVLSQIGGRDLAGQGTGGQRNYAHAIRRIDPQAGAAPIEMTIPLVPASTVTGRLVLPDGRSPEEAVMTSRLLISPSSPTWRVFAESIHGGRFAIRGCDPAVTCPVYFLAPRDHVGATVQVQVSDAGRSPLDIRLAPCGSVKMRFVDSQGNPVSGMQAAVEIVVTPGVNRFGLDALLKRELAADSDFYVNLLSSVPGGNSHIPESGDDGRVTVVDLIPGASYRLETQRETSNRELDFSVQPGQTRDLGDIVVDRPKGL